MRVRSAAALAATIPYVLGFLPDHSLVINFVDRRNRLTLTARFDFPSESGDLGAIAEVMSDQLVGKDITSVQLAAFTGDTERAVDALDALSALSRARGVEVLGAGVVEDDRWKPLTAAGGVAEPGESLSEGEPLDAVCEMILNGRSFLANRSEIVRMVEGAEEIRESVERELAGRPGRRRQLGTASVSADPSFSEPERRHVEESILGYLLGRRHAPGARELAEWAVAFDDSRVREPVLWRLSPASTDEADEHTVEEITNAWAWWLRATPAPEVAPVAAALAAFAWQSGNGVLARISASHALESDPTSRLGLLVIRAVNRSTSPSVWIDLMRSMSLDELRGSGD